ncbi:MAG: TetR family transcriptional regulator [Endomicrobiales bacterium]
MGSKEKIIKAAIEVFAEKGRHGARMEEIAGRAKINKAMLYYFYSTKENLYREVLSQILTQIAVHICQNLKREIGKGAKPADVVRLIVTKHIDAYSKNINCTRILLEAIASSPEDMRAAIELVKTEHVLEKPDEMSSGPMVSFFKDGVARGEFRHIDPKQLMISIVGMNMIYFIAKPISQMMLGMKVKDEEKFLKARKESIIDLVLYGIMEKRNI